MSIAVSKKTPDKGQEPTIKRVHQFGWSQTYTLYPGDPSADRLWHILRDQSRTRYPAQLGWGSTPANNTARTVWCL